MSDKKFSISFGIIRFYPTAIPVNYYWKMKLNIILVDAIVLKI